VSCETPAEQRFRTFVPPGSLLALLVGAISCYNRHPKFFPLWAMTRYRNLKRGNTRAAAYGM